LLSILTATAMADVRKELRWRQNFYERVKECLIRREGTTQASEELLSGLD